MKYLDACLKQIRQFNYLFVSLDGLLQFEAEATLKYIASRLATKCKEPYSQTCGYVISRYVINLIQEAHCCIQETGFRYIK